jgi:hypothetical protein
MIISGDFFKYKKTPISQRHICVFLSSLMFLNDLFKRMSSTIISNFSQDSESLNEVTFMINKIVSSGKQKISDICNEW